MVVYERSAFLAPGGFFGLAGMWLATKTKLTCSLKGLLQWFSTGNQKVGELTRGRFTLKGTVKIEAAEAEQSRLSVASKGQAPTTADPTFPKTQQAFRSIPTRTFSLKLLARFAKWQRFQVQSDMLFKLWNSPSRVAEEVMQIFSQMVLKLMERHSDLYGESQIIKSQ